MGQFFPIEQFGFSGVLPVEEPVFKGLVYDTIFVFYDGPLLFSCRTEDKTYLAMLLNDEDCLEYLYLPLEPSTLEKFRNDEIDLLDTMRETIEGKLYRVFLNRAFKIKEERFSDLKPSDLPDVGFFAGKSFDTDKYT